MPDKGTGKFIEKIHTNCFRERVSSNTVDAWFETPCHISNNAMCEIRQSPTVGFNIDTLIRVLPSTDIAAYSSSFPLKSDEWITRSPFLHNLLTHPCKSSTTTNRQTILFHHTEPTNTNHTTVLHDITLCDLFDAGIVLAFMPLTSKLYVMYDNTPSYVYVTMSIVVVYLTICVSNDLDLVIHMTRARQQWRNRDLCSKLSYCILLGVIYLPWKGLSNVFRHYITYEERLALLALLLYIIYQLITDFCRLCKVVTTIVLQSLQCGKWYRGGLLPNHHDQRKQSLPFDNLFDITLATIFLCLSTVYNTLDNSYTLALTMVWIVKIFYKLHLVPHQPGLFLAFDILVDFLACTALLFGGVLVSLDNNIHAFFMYLIQSISVALVLTSSFLRF